jgi:uncharacterized glyoxalase superfamily protein PhnB
MSAQKMKWMQSWNKQGKLGAIIVKPAQNTFWGGYAGYFQDPDQHQHLWEIVWSPRFDIKD